MRLGAGIASSMAFALALLGGVAPLHERDAVGQGSLRHAWLGIELDSRAELRGVRVRHAIRSSPAWNAGVRDGDVIVRVEEIATSRPDDVIREVGDRKSTRLNSSHLVISYAVFCLKKKHNIRS